MTRLDELPAELYTTILEQLECTPSERQHTIAAFIRALPRSPISNHLLYEDICLTQRRQAPLLYRTLRKRKEYASRLRVFSYHCFEADASQVVNVINLFQNLREMTLWIGPDFTPEDMVEIFEKPRESLVLLSLRFRPYVRRAMYYQFMAGAYFDSVIEALSNWPRARLPSLSIVQDPLPNVDSDSTGGFAQPLVFFNLQPIQHLVASPYLSTVGSFRFRIPARWIARYFSDHEHVLPSVELLDISTTRLSESHLEALVGRLARLKHLILDGCPLMPQRDDGPMEMDDFRPWQSLGTLLAIASIHRSKVKEGQYKAWAQEQCKKVAENKHSSPSSLTHHKTRKATVKAEPSRRQRTDGEHHSSSSTDPPSHDTHPAALPEKIHVIPPVPTITSFAITAPMISPNKEDFDINSQKVREAFARGWESGLHRIVETRSRMRNSWTRLNAAVYQIKPYKYTAVQHSGPAAMQGLAAIEDVRDFDFKPPSCPTLCLVGPGKDKNHPEGCPHLVAYNIWSDGW